MKETILTKAVDEVVQLKMKAVDKLLSELIEPLGEVGNPEKLIGKPYDKWDENDIAKLTQIYGQNSEQLNKFIFNKEYKKVQDLEASIR